MLALFRRNTPPPPLPAKKRLSRHKVRRFASLSLASLVLCLIAFRSLRTQSAVASAALEEAAHSVSEGSLLNISDGHMSRHVLHAQSQSNRNAANPDRVHGLSTFARNANVSTKGMDRTGTGARSERVTAHSTRENVIHRNSIHAANAREMQSGVAHEGYHAGKDMATEGKEGVDHLERFYHRDFVEEFGIPVTNSCVVTANTRASLKRHSIKDDAFYKYLKRSGKLELYQIRYAEVIDGGSGGLLPNSKGAPLHENLYYVKRTRQGRMGFGLFAAEDIPNGTILGEYGGKYSPCDKVENPEYLWDLPMFSMQGADGKWRNEQWGVDAMEMGNALRFCNDLGPETWNVITRYVPWNGLWHVIYETTTDVRRGEEFSISYGKAYWSRRHQLLKRKTS